MKARRIGNRMMRGGLAAVLAGGSLFATQPSGCDRAVQRELEVLTHPEANTTELYDSYLANQSWGRQLIKWWSQF